MKPIDGVAVLIVALLVLPTGCQPLPPIQDAAPAAPPVEPAPQPPKTPIPSGKLKLFQDAVHILHGKTVETFIRIEELEGKFAVMTIGVDDRLEMDSFTPVLEGRKLEILADLRFREAAADVMTDYAALLSAVSESQTQGPVDVAAEKLAGSLGILKNAPVPDGIGAAEVAGVFDRTMADLDPIRGETDREKALNRLMTDAQVDVQRLSALIIRDHEKFKTLVDKMIRGIIESANERRPLREDSIDPQLTAFDNRIATLAAESREIRSALDDVMAGFAQVPEAHFAIRNLLGRDLKGLPALQDLMQKARQADRRYRVLESDTLPLP